MIPQLATRSTALIATAIAALVVCGSAAQASIMWGGGSALGPQVFNADSLDSQLAELGGPGQAETAESGMSGASRSSKAGYDGFPRQQEEQPAHRFADFNPNSGTPGSSTSTTSSGGAPGGVTLAVLPAPCALLSDDPLAERYAAECVLFVPDAPGNELLRPPQG